MNKYKIKVIVEGSEEETFFEIVKEKGLNEKIELEIENVSGYGNIASYLINALREEDRYDCVICVYDVDNKVDDINSPFNIARNKIKRFFGSEKMANAVSFCTNPNILQMFLLIADNLNNVALKSTSKQTNSSLVHKYWKEIPDNKKDKISKNKSCYDTSKWQLKAIKDSIIYENYNYLDIFKNAVELSNDYEKDLPSSNLLPLLIALKDGNLDFFKNIKDILKSDD